MQEPCEISKHKSSLKATQNLVNFNLKKKSVPRILMLRVCMFFEVTPFINSASIDASIILILQTFFFIRLSRLLVIKPGFAAMREPGEATGHEILCRFT